MGGYRKVYDHQIRRDQKKMNLKLQLCVLDKIVLLFVIVSEGRLLATIDFVRAFVSANQFCL